MANGDILPPEVPLDAPVEGVQDAGFSLQIPRPFVLAEQSKVDLDKIKDEIMDKVVTWENRFSFVFKNYFIATDSWRIRPDRERRRGAKTLFNSKSGETHRATETIATAWHRMLMGASPWFEPTKIGLTPDGREPTEEDLFAAQHVLLSQQRASRFSRKALRSLRSTALMGACIAELPYVSLPYGGATKHIEFTDWVHRPIIRTGFDTTVSDVYDSDYVFFIDFFSKWGLRNQSSLDVDSWDEGIVERHIAEFAKGVPSSRTEIYTRVQQSRARAGYTDLDAEVFETIGYHGRLDPNPVIDAFAESIGLDIDPKFIDWSVSLLDSTDLARFQMTQYGDWRTRAKVLTFKDFEDEPIPYGIGQLGRKLQRMMDVSESLIDDKATFDVLNMWKIGKFSGYDTKQWIAEPMKAIELEDINQLAPLVGDPRVLQQMLNLIGIRREDFREVTGAKTNLQGQITKATATESAIAQNEAIRNIGVHAEILADTFREYLEISHVNNLNYLDEPIWVAKTGKVATRLIDKNKLPLNIGFIVKMVTDKDFRPDELQNIIQALQILSSGRNFFPVEVMVNASRTLVAELFRKLGKDPALLNQKISESDRIETRFNQLLNAGRVQGDEGGNANTGAQEPTNLEQPPTEPIPTSNVIFPEVSA